MSHFTVLVVGDNPEDQLAPFHEFECTGHNDQYIQDLDNTDEERADFLKAKRRKVRLADGTVVDPWDPVCFRDPTSEEKEKIGPVGGFGGGHGLQWDSRDWGDGLGYRCKIKEMPAGAVEFEEPYPSFLDYLTDYCGYDRSRIVPFGQTPNTSEGDKPPHMYGYILLDEKGEVAKVVRRTNPNAKWDWYQLGGRWTGFFRLRRKEPATTPACTSTEVFKSLVQVYLKSPQAFYEAVKDRPQSEQDEIAKAVFACIKDSLPEHGVGSPGLMTPPAAEGSADQAVKSDIDFDGMRNEAGEKAAKDWDAAHACAALHDFAAFRTWKQVIGPDDTDEQSDNIRKNIEALRKEYHDQPALVAVRNNEHFKGWWDLDEIISSSRGDYIALKRQQSIMTFALVKDGKWYEKGKMGFWAIVTDEKDPGEWNREYSRLLDELPDNTLLSVFDCHI